MINPKNDAKYKVACVVLQESCVPILGVSAAQQMQLLEIKHENIMKVETRESSKVPLTKEVLMEEFKDVFEGTGRLPGSLHLEIDTSVPPVVHPPRRVPIALKEALRVELEDLVKKSIIAKVTTPTDWDSSLVVARKPNGKLRICLDPKDLNKALKRSHYLLPTIEDVLPNMSGDEALEGLPGMRSIADDVLVQGVGDTVEEALDNHDSNVRAFLQWCRQKNLRLNLGKMKLKQTQAAYIGHLLTSRWQTQKKSRKSSLPVFGVTKFHQYVYGRPFVVQTNHKPLENIMQKPRYAAPKRLQTMLVKLQGYDVELKYQPGPTLYLADTLSRAYVPGDPELDSFEKYLNNVNVLSYLPISEGKLEQIRAATERDLSVLKSSVFEGWPEKKDTVPGDIKHYFSLRDQLSVHNGIILTGDRVVIPNSMRREMMDQIHSSHVGIEGCLWRARECLYWPAMNSEIRNFIVACEICNSMPRKQQETLVPHDVPGRPWATVGTDLCYIDGLNYLVTADYYSNFIEVDYLEDTRAETVVTKLKAQFSRHGIPDSVKHYNPGSRIVASKKDLW
ncbi:PREDICTED: uncharacterized protein K02A2.6-like [Priapulus caudatus]|uniref:RNA-directed DNA polymerase n=1 Tax=Priapulus caudatus TaxID=37621 RepID=A0ABM1EYJ5_PRICU|nr:PREDICTED: uncharacterized protein K02A2.6-like [Priapulus caudatus]